MIFRFRQDISNFLCILNFPYVQIGLIRNIFTWIVDGGLTDKFNGFGWGFGLDDDGLFGLFRLLYLVLGPFGLLLGDLFTLDGIEILFAEGQLSDGDVVDDDVEVGGPLGEEVTYSVRDLVSLGEKLGCWKLGHYCSQDLVANGWQHFLLIIFA